MSARPEPRPDIESLAAGNTLADATVDRDFDLTNEFASVRVRRVHTRNGVRLEISSTRLGTAVRLDALALESLTWQTPETFSQLLQQPFGPSED
ncbi:MAG: hypothetical protein NVSMB2_11980 [Chloroflexota bacterium]